ncbi:MAG TPA: hypothetical protein VGP94_16160 [Tepidisphaeraceae bacterium]|jgi:hypothetical protein|nr:hypothetical protein [Tepidisphaeraceae bacterium]
MSSVVVVAPIIMASWPAITAAVTAAVGSMGFAIASEGVELSKTKVEEPTRAEIEVEDSEIMQEGVGTRQQVVVERDGVKAIFTRDARDGLKLCMEDKRHRHSKSELKKMGQDLLGRVTQQYVYHKLVSELKERNMTIVDEEVAADRTVKLRIRNL